MTTEHEFIDGECKHCGIIEKYADDEPCEPEDLTMWCAPGQTPLDAIQQAAERDK
jgi:hypothetical protein